MSIKAILFDLDGTLLDTADDLTDSINYTLGEYDWPHITTEDTKRLAGNGAAAYLALCLPGGFENPHFTDVLNKYKSRYAKNLTNKTRPYSGVLDILNALKTHKVKTAIVSNKPDYAVKTLNEKFFKEHITIAMGENQELPRKPAPDMVFAVLDMLGCKKTESLYVGDSEVDIETAANAGISCVCVSWGFRKANLLKERGANIIIDDPTELLNYI